MPKVKQVVAAKDYPAFGIAKGEKHFHWVLKTGPRSSREFRQTAPPLPSQLTTSEFIGTLGDMRLEIETFVHDDSLADTITEFAERIRELGAEQQEKFDNMPEGFQQGATGELLQERADGCVSWSDDLDQTADQLRETLSEIDGKPWHELTEFANLDPEDEEFDESETPSDEEIEEARESERADAYQQAIDDVEANDPGL